MPCRYVLAYFVTFLCLVVKAGSTSTIKGNVEVSTNYGKVKGLILDFENGKGIHIFSGIPYAAPPIGDLRWKRPQKQQPWTGTYDATYYRLECHTPAPLYGNVSEDCLYLNIYTPYKGVGDGPYPVMYYIHGGAYFLGTGRMVPGHFLSQHGVVVVTVNYRLGPLGFLTTEDENSPGNYGLWDQHEGLIFVKENIRAFGGNPDDVTIFGNSAGATSASLHILAPKSQPLFQKAILMSGSDMATWAVTNPKWQPSDYTRMLAEEYGCTTSNNAQMVDCLRQMDADNITTSGAVMIADIKAGGVHFPFAPVVDGPSGLLPDTPANLRQRGEFAKIPIISGITSNEGSRFSDEEEHNRTEFLESIRELVEAVAMNNTEQQIDALNFEYTNWVDIHNGSVNRRRAADILSDQMFGAPCDQVTKSHSEYNDTYHYVFGYWSDNETEEKWMAVPHGGDATYIFGSPFHDETTMKLTDYVRPFNYTDQDRDFSAGIMEAWSNFAKYGNPTPIAVRNVIWEKFTSQNMQTLHLVNEPHILKDYRQHKYAFWREFYGKIINYNICPKRRITEGCTELDMDNEREIGSMMQSIINLLL